jgi:hypothetical protein
MKVKRVEREPRIPVVPVNGGVVYNRCDDDGIGGMELVGRVHRAWTFALVPPISLFVYYVSRMQTYNIG